MLDREERRARNIIHGDDPHTIDYEGLKYAVTQLATGNTIEVRLYDHHIGKHTMAEALTPSSSHVIIVEGSSALYNHLQLPYPIISIF